MKRTTKKMDDVVKRATGVRVDEELWKRFRKHCIDEGRPAQAVIEEILIAWCKGKEHKR
jgi:hypothetical protein